MSATSAIVIVGGGHAGGKAAIALRNDGHTGPITIVGEENHPPYERPPLSKEYLQGESEVDAMLLEPADWYAEHDITLRLGVTVTAIDRARSVTVLGRPIRARIVRASCTMSAGWASTSRRKASRLKRARVLSRRATTVAERGDRSISPISPTISPRATSPR